MRKLYKRHAMQDKKIIPIDGPKLVDLMREYGIGVQIRDTYHVKQIDEDFFEEE